MERYFQVPEPIVIVDYNPEWPAMYEKERARIQGATGDTLVAVEHIGSTAVWGLGAKPTIDIMAAVRRMVDADTCISALEAIGYQYISYPDFPERRFFRDGSMGAAAHHLHITEYMGEFWNEKLLFRDFLRTHSEEARQYELLKKELAVEYGSDREIYEPYTEAKTEFIRFAVARARSERQPR